MIDDLRAWLAARLPVSVHSLTLLGEGLDNTAYEVNSDLIVRVAKEPDAEAVQREADLLAAVSGVVPLPVPEPVLADPEAGVLAYKKLPGMPLLGHPVPDPARLAPVLGEFLSAVHKAGMEALAPLDDEPPSTWLEDAGEAYEEIADRMPREFRAAVEGFLAAAPPAGPRTRTFCHNDLGAEHILVDVEAGRITGVIDWTDAAIADPSYDLALVYRDLGPEVFDLTLAHYDGTCDRERALFYARCAVLEDIAHGLTTDGAGVYADAGLAHLPWLFGA
ncbi:phosphotransferase family protein [Actinomadura viridis]|uniref:phosphotransferase family protein n=1 Tax=Actinomadura viridis TaxID=58110 RepID=UPI003693F0A9